MQFYRKTDIIHKKIFSERLFEFVDMYQRSAGSRPEVSGGIRILRDPTDCFPYFGKTKRFEKIPRNPEMLYSHRYKNFPEIQEIPIFSGISRFSRDPVMFEKFS